MGAQRLQWGAKALNGGPKLVANQRFEYVPVKGADQVFTPEFVSYLTALHDRFNSRIQELRVIREEVLKRALKGDMPKPLPKSDANGDWEVDPMPDELRTPGIEISGPVSITPMLINALNPGPEGERAEGDLDDDEDSGGHRLVDTVQAALNRLAATQRTLSYSDARRNREYKLEPGPIPFFMHRERGLHLDEHEATIDGSPVCAALLGTALTMFWGGRAQIEDGKGLYWYLPKLESADEARIYRDVFDESKKLLNLPDNAVIKVIPLVESLPIVYQMEEVLYALGPYAAGLNAARWDLKASIFEYVMADPTQVWPDRFGVDIKTTDFIANIFRRLVAICLKHNGVPIGGMATALPSKNEDVNEEAATSIRADKEWEARHGFLRAWVAHIYHMKTAADPFKQWHGTGWKPTRDMAEPDNYPVRIEVPEGSITIDGTRRNCRMLIEYVEGWLNGRGAKGIDSLEGRPGVHPALMEDLATGRMSTAQIAQRIIHSSKGTDTGEIHSFGLVKRLLNEERDDILHLWKERGFEEPAAVNRYKQATKISMQWIKNYTDFDYRSLGTYTREALYKIADAPDAF